MLKKLLTAFAICSLSTSAGLPALAQDFEIECEVLDAQTGEPGEAFVAGDELLLRILVDVPPGPMQARVVVRASLKAKIRGFKFSTNFPTFHIDLPDQETREQIEGFEDAEEMIPEDFFLEEEVKLKLPDMLPDSTYTIKVDATLKGFGHDSCEKHVRITPN